MTTRESKDQPPLSPYPLLFIGGLCLCLGLFMTPAILGGMSSIERTREWPSVTGEIVQASKTRHTSVRKNQKFKFDGGTDVTTTQDRVVFRYRYVVDGKAYESTRYAMVVNSFSFVDTYAAGDPTTVFYDPANPSSAVLLRQRNDWVKTLQALLFGCGLPALVGVGFGAMGYVLLREKQEYDTRIERRSENA